MKTTVGLWIDHRKALMVFLTGKKVEKKLLESNVEKQLGRVDGLRSKSSYESQMVPADDLQERHLTGKLKVFYDKVISLIRDVESILVFGPGEAKGEFVKRIQQNRVRGNILAVETVDRMTDRQIVAKARQYYLSPETGTRDEETPRRRHSYHV